MAGLNTPTPGTASPTPAGSVQEIEDNKSEPEWKASRALIVIFVTICVLTLMAALDATSLSVALPIMAEKLGGSAVEAFWAGTSFLLASTVLQPSLASFSNIFGRRNVLLLTIVFFTVGAIVAGVADNFTHILVGRTIQGIGGGGVIAVTEILVTDLVPLRERGKWFGLLGSMWALGSVGGPLMGGGFAEGVSWRWIFYINLPFCGLGFVLVPMYLRLNQRMESLGEKLRRVDWIGVFLFTASTTSLLIPISWGGVMYPWDHWRTLVPLLLGVSGVVGFVAWEIYGSAEPMIPLRVFTYRTSGVAYIGTVCHGVVLWCILYYLPLYFEGVKDMSPTMSGVAVFPQTFTVAPAAVITGIVVTKTGRFRWAVWSGWVLTTAGMGIMSLLRVHTPTVSWIFMNLVAGIGTGLLFPSLAYSIQAGVSDEEMAMATGMFSFMRALGQTFGIAIGGVIFQNRLKAELELYPGLSEVAGEYAKDAVALVQVMKKMPRGQMRDDLLVAYTAALRPVWLAMIGFAGIGLIASLWIEGLSLDRALSSEQGLRTEKREEKKNEV